MITQPEVEKRLAEETAAILDLQPEEILPDTPLEELGMDSLSLVALLVFVEKNYGVNLVKAGLGNEDLRTVGALAACICRAGG